MTGPEPAVPPEAITAAGEAFTHMYRQLGRTMANLPMCIQAALEAAAPHLEAAAAERLAAWLEGPEATAVTANAIRAQVDREIAEAVAAERERCAQLAEQEHVMYTHSPHGPGCPGHRKPFADLLRQGGEGGGT